MILNKLKSWQYYEDLIPLYIKNSNGLCYHFKMLVDLLNVLDDLTDELFSTLNIMSLNLDLDFNIDNATDTLDKLGSFLGIDRCVHVKSLTSAVTFDEDIILTNDEYLSFIKAKIALNSFDGSRENANDIYEQLNLQFYMLNSTNDAEVLFYIDSQTAELTALQKLVLSGLMTLESMGISYVYSVQDISKLAHWDKAKYDSDELWGI